jgi:hypothetical protein
MVMATGTFATAINCIDGRTTQPVTDWLKLNLLVNYVDLVTIPGPDKALIQSDADLSERAKRDALVSVNAHHSQVIAIAGHHDCAGNPVSDEQHKAMIRQAAQAIQDWQLGVRVIGLFVNSSWWIDLVCDLPAPTPEGA